MEKALKRAAAIMAFAIGWSSPGLAQQALTPDQIGIEIIGRELEGRMGPFRASLIYGADGTVTMTSAVVRGGGTWAYSDTGICVDITSGPRKGKECLTFTANPDGTYGVSNGMTLTPR